LFLIIKPIYGCCQISAEDSTVQAIAYWDKGEHQDYAISLRKIKIKDQDTVSNELSTYDVEVTVVDSSSKSYTLEWFYKNYQTSNPDKKSATEKISKINENLKYRYTTDEMGSFIELTNWKEIRSHINESMKLIMKEQGDDPELKKVMSQLEKLFTTKEAIESAVIKDIRLYHTFHGAKYKLGEQIEGKIDLPNILGNKPLTAQSTVYLDEINFEDQNYVLRYGQVIDQDQLRSAVKSYLDQMAKSIKSPKPEESIFRDLKHETEVGCRIHNSGWVIYTYQTITVNMGEATSIEEWEIEIK
jgi:hypothetical protein